MLLKYNLSPHKKPKTKDDFSSSSFSGPSSWSVGEVPEAPHGLHQSAAAGAGEPVQTQQVPVQTQTLRGGHFTHADRDTGGIKKHQHTHLKASRVCMLYGEGQLEFKLTKS